MMDHLDATHNPVSLAGFLAATAGLYVRSCAMHGLSSAVATNVHRVTCSSGCIHTRSGGRIEVGGVMAEPVRARRLTDQEGQRLLQIVRRGKHGSVRVRRAMIIMASASGTLVPAIARLVAADEDTVRDVIHLFNQKGLAALDPQWAGGRPRLISDEDIEVIVAAAKIGRASCRGRLLNRGGAGVSLR